MGLKFNIFSMWIIKLDSNLRYVNNQHEYSEWWGKYTKSNMKFSNNKQNIKWTFRPLTYNKILSCSIYVCTPNLGISTVAEIYYLNYSTNIAVLLSKGDLLKSFKIT